MRVVIQLANERQRVKCGREKFLPRSDDEVCMRSVVFVWVALAACFTLGFACKGEPTSDKARGPGHLPGKGVHDAGSDVDDMFGNGGPSDAGVHMHPDARVAENRCGDGELLGDEQCEDGNARPGDGCDENCQMEPGWACLLPAEPCVAAECGDGIIVGDEQCEDDDSPPEDGDGCSAKCRFEPGYDCPSAGEPCHETVCNDGKKERGEPCDDGNQVIGDGCTPFCEVEPDCSAGACRSRCGDGLMLESDDEECDDGNTQSGDGCSDTCKSEDGYSCTFETDSLPDVLKVPVTYRDFIAIAAGGSTKHPDFETFNGANVTTGLVLDALDAEGKPAFAGHCDAAMPAAAGCNDGQQLSTEDNFNQWYRDTPGVNVTKVTRIMLMRDAADGAYRIAQAAFYPWDGDMNSWVGQGKETLSGGHDYGFTSEIRNYFTYTPSATAPQMLTFSGDDDVWVFINHQLVVDIGGLHPEQNRSVRLDDAKATQLGLEAGKIYEIVLFHAERHTVFSNFNLTLSGFVSIQSQCVPRCGDGIVAGSEECDDGMNAGGYGGCLPDCTLAPRCGDRVVQVTAGEECDDGNLLDGDTCTADCMSKGPG